MYRSVSTALAPRLARAHRAAALALLIAPGLLAAREAGAQAWSFVGARYQGMGGAGVAVVDDEHASYWNPGALAFTESYGVAVPAGVYAGAEGSTLSDIDRVSNVLDDLAGGEFDQLIDDLVAGNDLDPAQLGTALRLGADALPGLDDDGEGVLAGIDASLLLRYRRFAVTGIGESHFAADPVFDGTNVSLSDLTGDAAVDALVNPGTAASQYGPGDEPPVVAEIEAIFLAAGGGAPNLQAEEFVFAAELAGADVRDAGVARNLVAIANATVGTADATFADNRSGTFVRGLAVEQIGFGYGHPLLANRIGIGGNLKYMLGTTFNKYLRYDDIDGVGDLTDALTDSDRREITHTASLDLGVLVKPWDWLRLGITARNVTKPSFDLARDRSGPGGRDELTLDPQVRAGVALWVLPRWVVAFDADLTEDESELVDGFASRLVSLGTEWKIPLGKVGLALRGGAYLNTAADDLDAVTLTAGLGLRVFDFNLDLAIGASPKTEKVEAADDQRIPAQSNASLTFAFRRSF